MVVHIKMAAFNDVMPQSMGYGYSANVLWRLQMPLECWYLSILLHSNTSKKPVTTKFNLHLEL